MDDQPVTSRKRKKPRRKNDPERTKADILEIAAQEFASNGLSGARVDEIADKTRTSKRMIYYYFGDKERLYAAVLENAYSKVRSIEAGLSLDELEPEEALRRLVEQTFENDEANEDFVRLVAIENIHRGIHLEKSAALRKINLRIINIIDGILQRGRAAGIFRNDLDATDVHLAISAFCFFRVSNKHTFGKIFQVDLSSRTLRGKHKRMIVDAVLRLVRNP
jgi:AcrR family transcriptional regulator